MDARAFARWLFHRVGERRNVDADAARRRALYLGEVERKAERVIERECGHAIEHVAFLQRLARFIEDRKAALQRLAKARFFEL